MTGDALFPAPAPATSGALAVQRGPLVSITRPEASVWRRPDGGPSGWLAMARAFGSLVQGLATVEPRPTMAQIASTFRGMESVFLKQLPAASGSAPSYQAIVAATIAPQLDTVRWAMLPGRSTVSIPAYQEPRIVDTLGLDARLTVGTDLAQTFAVTPVAEAWMQFQGELGPGVELWRADV